VGRAQCAAVDRHADRVYMVLIKAGLGGVLSDRTSAYALPPTTLQEM